MIWKILFLEKISTNGINSISRDRENELMLYFTILILLYADDTNLGYGIIVG